MIPDPIERMERAQELFAADLEYDEESGTGKCAGCDKRYPLESLSPSDGTPYALPICYDCLERKHDA